MTNEEAREIIIKERDSLKANPLVKVEDCLYKAFDLAIKALEQQPCEDCISREAVDEYITNLLSGYLYDEERTRLEELTAYIWELPSVQPCEDCVSRKLLSDNICEGISCNECSFNEIDGESGCLLQKRFDELPSVQPTRPTARWETFVEDYNKCSKCGEMGKFYRIYKYCPNCGAKMGVEDEADN